MRSHTRYPPCPRSVWRSSRNFLIPALASICAVFFAHQLRSVQAEGVQRPTPTNAFDQWRTNRIANYQNRVRAFSHPLKVFETFASVTKSGGRQYMTPEDFVRSLLTSQRNVPPTAAGIAKNLEKVRSSMDFFRMADTDGDGLISYSEYMFFLSLLSTPEHHYKVLFNVFNVDGNEGLDLGEFQRVMDKHERFSQRMGIRERQNLSVARCDGLMSYFFHDKDLLTYSQFEAFLHRLRHEVLRLEFYSYWPNEDRISMKEFAYSLIAYTPSRIQPLLADRIEALEPMRERISWDQFEQFDKLLRKAGDLDYALEILSVDRGSLSRGDLKTGIRAATQGSVQLTDGQLEVLDRVFEFQSRGRQRLIEAMKSRVVRGFDRPKDLGFVKLVDDVLAMVPLGKTSE